MLFRVESHDDATRHSVRTEVTVQEQQNTVLLTSSSWSGPKTCPLCGNPMFPVPEPLSEKKAQALKLGHRDGQGTCPGPGKQEPAKQRETKGSRHGEDSRRLR
jgi:hypothetical protein